MIVIATRNNGDANAVRERWPPDWFKFIEPTSRTIEPAVAEIPYQGDAAGLLDEAVAIVTSEVRIVWRWFRAARRRR